jgi:phosphopantetheinyl transferase
MCSWWHSPRSFLQSGALLVALASLDEWGAEASLLEAWMSKDECARVNALVNPQARMRQVVSYGLQRLALAHLLRTPPHKVNIRRDCCASCGLRHGRPITDAEDVHMSVSHSGSLVAIGLSTTNFGLDIEPLLRMAGMSQREIDTFASAVLDATELADYLSTAPSVQRGALLDYWVMKEATLKARGTGLRTLPKSVRVGPLGASGSWSVRSEGFSIMFIRKVPGHTVGISHLGPPPKRVDLVQWKPSTME